MMRGKKIFIIFGIALVLVGLLPLLHSLLFPKPKIATLRHTQPLDEKTTAKIEKAKKYLQKKKPVVAEKKEVKKKEVEEEQKMPEPVVEEEGETDIAELFDWGNLSEEEKNQRAVTDWMVVFLQYDGEDRSDILEAALLALRSRGTDVVLQISEMMEVLPQESKREKSGLIYALGEIGRDWVETTEGVDATVDLRERETINDLLLKEIRKTPEQLRVEEMQHRAPIQLAAIQALASIGDEMAEEALEEVANDPNQEAFVREAITNSLFESEETQEP